MVTSHRRGFGDLPGPGIGPSDTKKLWIIGILFAFLLAVFFGVKIWGNAASGKKGERSSFPVDLAQPESPKGLPEMKYQSPSMTDQRDTAEALLQKKLADFVGKGVLKDDDTSAPASVLSWLLVEAYNDTQVTQIPERLYRALPEKEYETSPGSLRGRLTTAFGPIVAKESPIPFKGVVKGLGVSALYPVLFRTAEHSLYRAILYQPISFEKGDWIQVYGIFYRAMQVDVGKKTEKAYCLIATKKVRKAFAPRTVTRIDPAWAKQVHEASFRQSNNIDEPPFWLIMNYVKNLGVEGYRKLVTEGKIHVADMSDDLDARQLSRDPGAHRFQAVLVKGRIIARSREYLLKDNPGKIRMMSSAILELPSAYMIRLASPRPWVDYDFKGEETFVKVEGFFYKRWQYIPKLGGPPYEIPLMIVSDVTPIRSAPSPLTRYLQWAAIVAAVIVVLAFLFFAFRDARARQAFKERVLEKKRQRLNREKGE